MDKIHSLTGMLDLYNDGDKDNLSAKVFEAEKVLRRIFSNYQLNEMRTPALEDTDLFKRSVGDLSDIVNKEIYSFNDRNEKSIALRPEGTAGVIRAIIEKKLDQSAHKLWYLGPMWRYERPQKGRYRQFYQAGVEILGYPEGAPEFEIISIICSIIEEFKLNNCSIKINHLGSKTDKESFCEALVNYLEPLKDNLDIKDLERLSRNPLRILDSKNEDTQFILRDAPSIKDFIDSSSIQMLQDIRSQFSNICSIEIDYSLVRGLDYYSGFVFETVSSDLGAQNSFLGGGRYDDLCSNLGGRDLPSIGMAIGIERFASLLDTVIPSNRMTSFLVVTSNLEPKAYKIAHKLRSLNNSIDIDVQLSDGSLKSKLRRANKDNAAYALILGEDEFKSKNIIVKSLLDVDSEQVTMSFKDIDSFIEKIK